eukprot:7145252-Prymnesium_polylepis.1
MSPPCDAPCRLSRRRHALRRCSVQLSEKPAKSSWMKKGTGGSAARVASARAMTVVAFHCLGAPALRMR